MKIKAEKTYKFSAPIMRKSGEAAWYYVLFPFDVEEEFGTKGIVRMKGTYNNNPCEWALIPLGDGTHHIIVSGEMRKKAGIRLGNIMSFELMVNTMPYEIIIPEELEEGFELEPGMKARFEVQKLGFKKNMIVWLNQAKQPETKAKRVAEILRRLSVM